MAYFKYLLSKIIKKCRLASVLNSNVHKTSKVESGSSFINSSMGKYSFCGYDCDIVNTSIGSFCSIANGVIIGGGEHPIDWVSTSPVFYKGRDSVTKKFSEYDRKPVKTTYVGHDVWIGRNVLVKQGIVIGNGAVVGMGSVVTKDVPPYAIICGNPAKVIKYRFDSDVISSLESIEWWHLSEQKLKEIAVNIKTPHSFIKGIIK
ncbi:Chloramphenicol O-acetyltransferase [Vibrio scophthalmi]|uniref:CatB-related O-acetyltransferase n=1 Tax=Vibrio scophthalmi TaxID=45658 RepID=UPI0008091E07|nr:CatB-related O-acetyltransferase [Vibrio scophthalmi]ANS84201.1 Chloramphenicol O-acetyltransferase [Vibrio scophthalmi]